MQSTKEILELCKNLSTVKAIEMLGAESLLVLAFVARVAKDAEGVTEPLHSSLEMLEKQCEAFSALAAKWAA